jgi:hypothetical protein
LPAPIVSPVLPTAGTPSSINRITTAQSLHAPPTLPTGSSAVPCAVGFEAGALTAGATAPSTVKRKRVYNKKLPAGDGSTPKPKKTHTKKQPKTQPADTSASAEDASSQSYERNRHNGRKLTAVAADLVNGQLVPIQSQENDALSTPADAMQGDASALISAASLESAFAHESVSNTMADPISGPVADFVSGLVSDPISGRVCRLVSGPEDGLFSGPTYGIVDSPPDGFAASPACP